MKNQKLKKKIASYGALSAAFLASGSYEAEAQIVYMDPADIVIQVSESLDITNAFDNGGSSAFVLNNRDNVSINFNVLNGTLTTNSPGGRVPSNNPYIGFNVGANIIASRIISTTNPCKDSNRRCPNATNTSSNVKIYGSADARNGVQYLSTVDALNIPYGVDIGSGNFGSARLGLAGVNPKSRVQNLRTVSLNSDSAGNFANDPLDSEVEGYIGFEFDKNGQNHFGWARVKLEIEVIPENDLSTLSGDPARNINTRGTSIVTTTLTIMDYAYNDTPDTAIAAGANGAAIPTMGQWGLVTLNLLLLIFGIVAVKDRDRLVLKKRA